ncbi:hypothetical protein ER308_10890 [Egibacter rhizosphaerae]|uniref:Zinc-finger domain-containing protein n=1 Tax=Egibacter rhizosphaerae TaxID=1670831 RepID=A0A411YFJ7_9ACTN|nr:hypothetical protein [Egibacter rhizosphaerae]QBI20015.1 hypothetical protein ER308_10890 [Egibacter rhizosphaerae]
MTDHRDPHHAGAEADGPGDEELAAYLEGELDERDVARLEARIATDPEIARRLDTLAAARVELRDIDAVTPPAGYRERLAGHLDAAWDRTRGSAAAIATPTGDTSAASDASAGEVTPAAVGRSRRAWKGPLGIAAAIALAAVALPTLLNIGPTDDATTDDADVAEEAAPDEEALDEGAPAEDAPDEDALDAESRDVEPMEEPDADAPADDAPADDGTGLAPLRIQESAGPLDDAPTHEEALAERYRDDAGPQTGPADPAAIDARWREVHAALEELGAEECAGTIEDELGPDAAVLEIAEGTLDGSPGIAVLALTGDGERVALLVTIDGCEVTARTDPTS